MPGLEDESDSAHRTGQQVDVSGVSPRDHDHFTVRLSMDDLSIFSDPSGIARGRTLSHRREEKQHGYFALAMPVLPNICLEAMSMFNAEQLCEKITALYPEIGICGLDIEVRRNYSEDAWVVHLKKDSHSLKHFLELKDAIRCVEGDQCVALGLEISQLKLNIEGKQF